MPCASLATGDDVLIGGPGTDDLDGGADFDVVFTAGNDQRLATQWEVLLHDFWGYATLPNSTAVQLDGHVRNGSPSRNPWDPIRRIISVEVADNGHGFVPTGEIVVS